MASSHWESIIIAFDNDEGQKNLAGNSFNFRFLMESILNKLGVKPNRNRHCLEIIIITRRNVEKKNESTNIRCINS